LQAEAIVLSPEIVARVNGLINQGTVTAARYNSTNQSEVDTEEF